MSGNKRSSRDPAPSGNTRGGIFSHEISTSPHAISSSSRDHQPVERSIHDHSHSYPKSKDVQMSELVDTINTYRIELDTTTRQMEDFKRRYEDLELRNKTLESQNRSLKSRNEVLERRNQSLEHRNESLERQARETKAAEGAIIENPIRARPTNQTPLALMPPPTSGAIVRRSAVPAPAQHYVDHLSNHFHAFFQQAEIWANTYANAPVAAALQSVIQKFNKRKMNVAIPSQLLHDPETRCHTMTKLILHSMIDATFQPRCFENFNPDYSGQLQAEYYKVYGGIPSKERKALAEARTSVIKKFVQSPNWAAFLNQFVSSQCSGLWQLLQPVFGPGTALSDAWPSFVGLFREAVSIALAMHQRVCLFRFDFPPVGEGSAFNPADMVVIPTKVDRARPFRATGPQRLKLSVTPVVRKTQLGESNAIGETVPICKARVLLE